MNKQEKRISVGLVVCFVAMIAIVGMITFSQYERNVEEEKLAEIGQEQQEEIENTQTTNTEHIQSEIEDPVQMEIPEVVVVPAPSETSEVISSEAISFSANDVLDWPIEGNVILNYSMEQSIYFATLDQYKYNPAIIISGNVGDEVRAAATGRVTSIKVDTQTGVTVTMDLGNGYEMICGQLENLRVREGDTVQKGTVIGVVAEPSKYYVVEGPNVYFQMLKDGKPVNPLEYMGE